MVRGNKAKIERVDFQNRFPFAIVCSVVSKT